MRLKSIKLAGFKSFVDPATVNFLSNLACVVGPNGCGKSNVIDAVRWVMGESSAKQLRGDSMTDVIFNGSSSRKPIGQCTVELIFDNSQGRISGEYANYNEISVKRKVTREGQSNYYLNSTQCRRRDITDLFLGTGLGPRSYSIIEQGMISNLITAQPADLRVYIEEAAGISKYRERRKDTENRIRRSRENLERITDVRDELGRQIQRLHRQAKAAEKYRTYKEQERNYQQQLIALRWQVQASQLLERDKEMTAVELNIEKVVTEELACNSRIEKMRQQSVDGNQKASSVQSQFYQFATEIAATEQAIKNHEEQLRQRTQDFEQTQSSFAELQSHLKGDESKQAGWQAELEELARQRLESESKQKSYADELQQAKKIFNESQSAWSNFQESSAKTRQEAELEQSSIKHLEMSLQSLQHRKKRLTEQAQAQLGDQNVDKQLLALQKTIEEKTAQLANLDTEQHQVQQSLSNNRQQLVVESKKLDDIRSLLQQQRGRLSSLQALQEAALQEGQLVAETWLTNNDLGQCPRLADEIKVDKGWELAVETVLNEQLKAVVVDDIEQIAPQLQQFKDGKIQLLQAVADAEVGLEPDRLSSKVTSLAAQQLLGNVFVADDLAGALAKRSKLTAGQSVVTVGGIWLGKNWCLVERGVLVTEGVIERKAEISQLEQAIAEGEKNQERASEELLQIQQGLKTTEEKLTASRKTKDQGQRQRADAQSQFSALQAKHEQLVKQAQLNQSELNSIDQQQQQQNKKLSEAKRVLSEKMDLMEQDSANRESLLETRDEHRQQLNQLQSKHDQSQQSAQQLGLREKMVQTQLSSLQETMTRVQSQVGRVSEKLEQLKQQEQTAGEQQEQPIDVLKQQLQSSLSKRLTVEQELKVFQEQVRVIDGQIQQMEKQRVEHGQALLSIREKLQTMRLSAQDLRTRLHTLEEQLGKVSPQEVLADLPEEASQQQWASELETVQNRINRLGPINLAAIDEFESESARKTYLDEQNDELVEALETLEAAIRKIDRETRARFKETFDRINSGFKVLFPQLFGGGHAYLELTGDDMLDTGVNIMARPPGKRNSTIHLLSGGEKAMVAIALVFSIFQLNPAPFCMLDEVDAPLDDANVSRFASVLKKMSSSVQFIFVTHNKGTMEISDQLMGVTMHEPGVSRLVTVDIESALKMVEE